MNISAVNQLPQAFTGTYKLNANQEMPNQEACLLRDTLIGAWSAKASNGEDVVKQLHDFYTKDYEKNKTAPCNIELKLPDADNTNFEDSMNKCGQKFDKIA